MTYLELCQAVVDQAGLSGQMSSVDNQTGDFGRIVRYVKSSCRQLEARWINYKFLYDTYEFETTADVDLYPAPEDLNIRQWDLDNAFIDNDPIDVVYFDDKMNYKKLPNAEDYTSRPIRMVIKANNTLRMIGTPDDAYSIEIGYYKKPTTLVNNTDEPLIPDMFQEIIVFDALSQYANYDEAPELKQDAMERIYGVGGNWQRPEPGSLLHSLQADQLPYSYQHGATQGGMFVVRAE
jgi:hypothetical protein